MKLNSLGTVGDLTQCFWNVVDATLLTVHCAIYIVIMQLNWIPAHIHIVDWKRCKTFFYFFSFWLRKWKLLSRKHFKRKTKKNWTENNHNNNKLLISSLGLLLVEDQAKRTGAWLVAMANIAIFINSCNYDQEMKVEKRKEIILRERWTKKMSSRPHPHTAHRIHTPFSFHAEKMNKKNEKWKKKFKIERYFSS